MCGGDDEEKQPEVTYTQPPEYAQQMELFKKYQEPYMAKQFGLYSDIMEPSMRSLGGILGKQLEQPLQLPEETWANIQQKGLGTIEESYKPIRQAATERAAGSGMLGQGATEKYMQSLDLSKAKSIEDFAVDMVIQEWQEKKTAQQQSIQNMLQYQGYQPAFNLTMPTSSPITSLPQEGGGDYSGLGTGLGALGGLGLGALLAPATGGLSLGTSLMYPMLGAGVGAVAGGGIGSMFR